MYTRILGLSNYSFRFIKDIEEQLKRRGITNDKDVSEIYLADRLGIQNC